MKGFITIINMGDGKYKPIIEGITDPFEVLDMLQAAQNYYTSEIKKTIKLGEKDNGGKDRRETDQMHEQVV